MKNKEIISAVTGSAFFAIPYLGLSLALAPSLIMGGVAFVGSELILSGIKPKETLKTTNKSLYTKIITAKYQNQEIKKYIKAIENSETQENLKEITETVDKIIGVVEKEPKKEKKLNNFFEYYLPVLLSLVSKYDEIENQRLTSKEGLEYMKKSDKMIGETNKAFKSILSSLYQNDIVNADAEMKVYDTMLKADGIIENPIMKGVDEDE